MCEPLTIAAVSGIGLGAVGSGISAYGSYKEGQEAGAAADQNARLVRLQARDVMQRGQAEAGAARMEGTKVIAEQKTAIAAAGVDPSVGSAADLAGASRANSELDAATIRNNAAREAWGLQAQAKELTKQGDRARQAGKFGAAGGILGGAAGTAQGIYSTFGKR